MSEITQEQYANWKMNNSAAGRASFKYDLQKMDSIENLVNSQVPLMDNYLVVKLDVMLKTYNCSNKEKDELYSYCIEIDKRNNRY